MRENRRSVAEAVPAVTVEPSKLDAQNWSFGPQSNDDLSDVTPDIRARIKNWD